jgi:Methyltransferase domain
MAAAGPIRVLDVGGHHSDFWGRPRRPIAEFLPELDTVTLDVGLNPLAGYVRGRGDALPFRSRSFDLVCAVDVLEHVPMDARPPLVHEMTRASTRAVLLAAPFAHPEVERAERFLTDFIQRTCGYDQGQLREHRDRGLPDLAATCETFARAGWHLRIWPYGNLWRWLVMMIDKHAVQALPGSRRLQVRLDRQYNERWFAGDSSLPCYRYFIGATARGDDPLLPWLEQEMSAAAHPAQVRPPDRIDGIETIWDLIALHAANQTRQAQLEPERRDDHVAELEALRAELFTHLDAVKRENARLAGLLRDVEHSPTYRVMAALKGLWPFR